MQGSVSACSPCSEICTGCKALVPYRDSVTEAFGARSRDSWMLGIASWVWGLSLSWRVLGQLHPTPPNLTLPP